MTQDELAKDLGLLSALTIGIGTMIGAGIFVLPGTAAAEAGPAAALAFVVGGVIALFTAFSASELGTAMPKAGGAYYYINQALGPLFGSISGWGNWMGLAFASAFYCIGFGSYINVFFALPELSIATVTITGQQFGAILAAIFFIGVNYIGAKETGQLQIAIVFVLLAILTLFTVFGISQADLSTLRPFAPMGYGAVVPATAIIFVSYLGFVQITTVGEEIKNPGRNLPIAIIGSVLIVTTIYALVILTLMGVINWTDVAGNDTAVVAAGELVLGGVGAVLLTIGGLLATASSANASILSSARINFAMGRDKIVSAWLNEIHENFATPYRSILVTGAAIIVFIIIGDVETLAKAGSVLHLIVYGLLNAAVLVFRTADRDDYNPDFTVPLYPLTPILGMVLSFGLIAFMETIEVALSLLFVAAAIVWYLAYARRHTTSQGLFGQQLAQFTLDRSDSMPKQAVGVAETVRSDGDQRPRIVVPLSNPETEKSLITLASALANRRGGTVTAVHIVQVPDQTPLSVGSEHVGELDADSKAILESAREDAETFGAPVETRTVLSHRSFEEVFDAARTLNADTVVMGWGAEHFGGGRAERPLDELTHDLPCDFLVLKDRGFEPARILVPTAGGPDSELSAEVAADLQTEFGAEVTLLHVVDEGERAEGEAFLADWAADHGLEDVTLRVEVSDDVEDAIQAAAAEHTFLVIGATERGLLSRLVRGSLVFDAVDDVDCSVLLAERPTKRTLFERLFGGRNY